MKLTDPQRRALEVLAVVSPAWNGTIAKKLWPDSTMHTSGRKAGYAAANAARMMGTLVKLGLARRHLSDSFHFTGRWEITEQGREVLAKGAP